MMLKEDMVLAIKATVLGAFGALTALWGWFGWMVITWVLLMGTDWVMGCHIARKQGSWSSSRARDGAWHKGGMMLVFVVALVADWMIATTLEHIPGVDLPVEYSVLLAPLVVMWYIVGEMGSLVEHAITVGAKVPPWLLKMLAAGQRAIDTAGDAAVPDELLPQEPIKIDERKEM